MLLATLSTALLFFVSVFGLAWPLAARLALDPAEKLMGNMPLCEQPLVLLALAFLASQWRHFSRGWRRLLIVGAAIDLLAGIVLQFGVQSHLFDRWLTPERSPAEYFSSYTEISLMNLRAKHHLAARFFSESLGSHPALALALVGALLLLAVTRARRPTLNPTD